MSLGDLLAIPVLVVFLSSFFIAFVLVLTQDHHGHLSMDSAFGVQKFHEHPTPRIGGVAIVVAAVVGYGLAMPEKRALLGPLMLAGIPAFAFGLLEDITKKVGVRTRLLATMACGFIGWFLTGLSITDANMLGLDWMLQFTWVSVLFTAFCVAGIANAINIVDGFNGLAGGSILIILGSFAALAFGLGDVDLGRVCLILMASVAGFLLVNWPFGKLFLGDGGAYFVGFAIGWLAVLMLARHPSISAWAPLLICGHPILEVLFSIARRYFRHASPGDADRLHLHSLVYRRVAGRLTPYASGRARNSATGVLMWPVSLVPAALALQWPTHTFALVASFVGCALLYLLSYRKLVQFGLRFKTRLGDPSTAKASSNFA